MTDVAGVALVALAALSMVGHGLFAAIPRGTTGRAALPEVGSPSGRRSRLRVRKELSALDDLRSHRRMENFRRVTLTPSNIG